MPWVAKKILRKVGAAGDTRYPGDEVPEAADWKRRDIYVENGSLEWIDDERVGVKEASPKTLPIEPLVEIEPAPSIEDTEEKKPKKKGRILKRS